MGCIVNCRQDEDGNKVNIILKDDLTVTRRLASDMKTQWTGTPSTLAACMNEAQKIVERCTVDAFDMNLAAASVDGPESITITEISRKQYGECVGNAICETINAGPYTENVPAVSDIKTCVLALQVTMIYDQGASEALPHVGTQYSDPVLAYEGNIPPDSTHTYFYLFDPTANGGQAGDTITIDNVTGGGRILQIYWSEICSTNGAELTSANFSLGDTVSHLEEDIPLNGNLPTTPKILSEYPETTTCDAIYIAAARHVKNDFALGTDTNIEIDWLTFSETGIVPTYMTTSYNSANGSFFCQIGSSIGVVPQGTAAFDMIVEHNQNGYQGVAGYIPLNCEGVDGGPQVTSPLCDMLTAVNDQGGVSGEPVKSASVEVSVTAAAGASVEVIGVLDGTDQTTSAQVVDNTAGAAALTQVVTVAFSVDCPTVVDMNTVQANFGIKGRILVEGDGGSTARVTSGSAQICIDS